MAVEKQGYRATLAISCFAAAPTQPSASSAGNVQNLTSGGVGRISVPHPGAQFPCLIPFRFHLFGLIRSFQWDKRDPYFEHNKLPHSLSQDLCPYVLNSCCLLRNTNGSEIVVVTPQPGSQHLRLWLFNTAPVPLQTCILPAGSAQPARVKQEWALGTQPENSANPCSTWMCPFLTKELCVSTADLHPPRRFSAALPRSCPLLSGSDPRCCSMPQPPQRHKGKAVLPVLSLSGGTSVKTHPQPLASAAVSCIKWTDQK